MVHPNFKQLRAMGTLVGSLVGAGILGVPYAFAQSGAAIGAAWLLALGAIMLAIFLMYAEVALQTQGTHRVAGYVGIYLGRRWGRVAAAAMAVALCGAMLAHIIIGSGFLHTLLSPLIGGSPTAFALAMAVAAGAVTWRGTKGTSRVECVIVTVLLLLFGVAILASLPHMAPANLAVIHPASALLPYGLILFALSGVGCVPEIKDVLGAQKRRLPHVITFGLFFIVVLYLAFSLAVVGVTGEATTPQAFEGLSAVLGPVFGMGISFLGALILFSVFSMSSLQLQNMLRFDLRVPRLAAWTIASFIPPALFLLGLRNFIGIVGFVGAVLSGTISCLIVFTYERMRRSPVCTEHRCLNVPSFVSIGAIVLFSAGAISALVRLFT